MNPEGFILIGLGLGLLWSAKTHAEDVSAFSRHQYAQMKRRGWPRWVSRLLVPPMNRSSRTMTVANHLVAALVIAAGVLLLVGVWSF